MDFFAQPLFKISIDFLLLLLLGKTARGAYQCAYASNWTGVWNNWSMCSRRDCYAYSQHSHFLLGLHMDSPQTPSRIWADGDIYITRKALISA